MNRNVKIGGFLFSTIIISATTGTTKKVHQDLGEVGNGESLTFSINDS